MGLNQKQIDRMGSKLPSKVLSSSGQDLPGPEPKGCGEMSVTKLKTPPNWDHGTVNLT